MNKKKVLIIILVINVLLIGTVVGVVVWQNQKYKEKWYEDTYINQINVSGMTLEQTKQRLLKDYQGYSLTLLGRNQGELVISGDDIDYEFIIGEELQRFFDTQHQAYAILYKGANYTVNFSSQYDKEKVKDVIKSSSLVIGSDDYEVQSPQNAYVEYDEEKVHYRIVEEEAGNELLPKKLLPVINQALTDGERLIDISDEAGDRYYKKPKITSEDEELQEEVEIRNGAIVRYIVWNLGEGYKEVIRPKQISEWVTYNDGEITYDDVAIEKWVESFCLKYKTVGRNRQVKGPKGKMYWVYGGDYGWRLDYDQVLYYTLAAVKKELEPEDIRSYVEDSSTENRKKITMSMKVPYKDTAQVLGFGDDPKDYDPDNYTLVSLEEQMVYIVRDGKIKFSCKCITGLPKDDRETTKGTYFIKDHRTNYTLVGDTYRTLVAYWVRITWMGIGFHPATWQSWSTWTKDKYKTVGSHGCVNLSPEDAKTVYEMTQNFEAVFIY